MITPLYAAIGCGAAAFLFLMSFLLNIRADRADLVESALKRKR